MTNATVFNQIVFPTQKWQVTIPKKIREEMKLKERKPLLVTTKDGKIYLTPIKKIVTEKDFFQY